MNILFHIELHHLIEFVHGNVENSLAEVGHRRTARIVHLR